MTGARQRLESHIASPMLTEFAQERVELAEKALKKKVKRAMQPELPGYAALHEVRIAGKKVRYLLQFFSPVLDGSHQQTSHCWPALRRSWVSSTTWSSAKLSTVWVKPCVVHSVG